MCSKTDCDTKTCKIECNIDNFEQFEQDGTAAI